MKYLRREPGFYRRLFLLALPLILQNLITTSLGFVDTFMVGLLGSDQLSAVTAANAPIFLIQVIIFGLMSGLTILVSQYWGKQDIASINRCMGFAMYAGLAISILMAAVLFFFPSQVLSLVTDNRTLIEMGEPYLKIVGISYIFNSVSSVYVSMQRSAENPSLGMKVFAASMLLNTFLNYCLIFGKLGAPALGIQGAALATLIARVFEFIISVTYVLVIDRRLKFRLGCLLTNNRVLAGDVVKNGTPVVINELMWSLATSAQAAILGHITYSAGDPVAANSIAGVVQQLSTVVIMGIANAAAVMVGMAIGENNMEKAEDRARSFRNLSVLAGIVACLFILAVKKALQASGKIIPWQVVTLSVDGRILD